MSPFTHSISSSLILQPFKIPKPSIFSAKPRRNFTLIVTCDSQSKSRKPAMDGRKPTSKFRRKSSYGTSRRSILKKTFSQEQVTFTSALSDDPLIAIIGGGMAGIMCALSLEKRGVRSTVFDTVGYYLEILSCLKFSLVLTDYIHDCICFMLSSMID